MDDLTTIIELASKYGTSAFVLGIIYLIVKATRYVMDLLKKISALEIQVSLNKERLNQIERKDKNAV